MEPTCIYFKGDRPCKKYWEKKLFTNFKCSKKCPEYKSINKRILLIKLDAIGDVLRTTPLAEGIKKKYHNSHLTWLVSKNAYPLIKDNPFIDRILKYPENSLIQEKFDITINLDKDKKATSLANKIKSKKKKGFLMNKYGCPYPINKGSERLYKIALDNWGAKKRNNKNFQEMIFEAADIKYNQEDYFLKLNPEHVKKIKIKTTKKLIGINTGCGPVYPHKKWVERYIIKLIKKLKEKNYEVVLLGGPLEEEKNKRIEKLSKALNLGNEFSIKEFAALINKCDIIVTGDTVALHIAIALKKPTIALFGPTPSQEIKLDHGQKIIGEVECINCYDQFPCIKEKEGKPTCMESITPEKVFKAIENLK